MKTYESLFIDVIRFEALDVITASIPCMCVETFDHAGIYNYPNGYGCSNHDKCVANGCTNHNPNFPHP